MSPIPWTSQINFASALLLHSCITVLLKEAFNVLEISRRLLLRCWIAHKLRRSTDRATDQIRTSIVLDAYTSIFSNDLDGELAELYFTNTGFALLAVSLASSVAMNILLSSNLLNIIVSTTFGVAFLASLVIGEKGVTLPILALRRAGRFIWSDTPFVNFFSLIYIATVLRGQSTLRLQDYVIFRSIAVLELIFMKAKLAASSPQKQIQLLRQLIESEWIVLPAQPEVNYLNQHFPPPLRSEMVPFITAQRLSVMLFKTAVGFHFGCLQGALGPASCPLPDVGCYVDEAEYGWRIYRLSEDIMVLSDCLKESSTNSWWRRVITKTHGILLRQLGKVRVIYLLQTRGAELGRASTWHSNINLVTGVTSRWLEGEFRTAASADKCVIAAD